ncbi:hypothetical protein [Heyndrickxia acidiproducens]|uniref:hypothetical protein n=1 Tax=Heyndrickxia acidiproducens TaxID=1121084 RepID=UPI0003619718|nr:hypothetical protein [Heyndrickxia acidiproducens]
MKEFKKIFSLILLQHLLHYRWFVNRIYPGFVMGKRFAIISIVNLAIGIFIISFITAYSFFKIISNNVGISTITGEKIFIIYYILLFIYLMRNSFNEAYIRAFHSKDYYYLRLQKVSPITLQVAKIIDAFFLEIVLFILPIHLGITAPFIIVFHGIELWGWTTVFILVVILSLFLRGLFMIILYLIDNHKLQNRKTYSVVGKIVLWMIYGWFVSFSIMQYILNKEMLLSMASTILNIRMDEPLHNTWVFGGGLAIFLVSAILSFFYMYQKRIDRYRIEAKVIEKRKIYKIENALFRFKMKSKWVSLFLKDLLLLIRGEYISSGFLKANLVFFSFFLGAMSALSIHYNDGTKTGIVCMIIIVYQLISNELITQSISKISSIDQERNWLKFYYTHMNNPYFIYFSKLLLLFTISFCTLLISTIIILIIIRASLSIILLFLLSTFCISFISSMSFLVGNACFPNFKWETEDQINTSIPGYITENIFSKVFQIIIISISGTNTVFLFAQKITIQDFIVNNIELFTISTLIWAIILFFILRAPLWKGWKW